MSRRSRYLTGCLLGATLLVGCGKQIPKDIIQPAQMENLLYDYHLGLAMESNLSYEDNYQRAAFKNYVLEKHGVSMAEFDSSMVWYTRHTAELASLYQQVGDRFRSEKKQMQYLLALRENRVEVSAPGDTVDIWYDRKLYWLTDAPLVRRITFEIPTDSNFHPRDRFVWSADLDFLSEGSCQAMMGFNVLYENDSLIGNVVQIHHSGPQQLVLQSDSSYHIRKVSGFVYYASEDSAQVDPGLIISNLKLMRYHDLSTDSTCVEEGGQSASEQVATTVQSNGGSAAPLSSSNSLKVKSSENPTRLEMKPVRQRTDRIRRNVPMRTASKN